MPSPLALLAVVVPAVTRSIVMKMVQLESILHPQVEEIDLPVRGVLQNAHENFSHTLDEECE